ncbi:MAG: HAMP domain-containing histidine kinase, partial [Burkholderiaceae bacterium]|nr:HAMP domain-containing histidine kinase [Burkholderiaceae bacterium]
SRRCATILENLLLFGRPLRLRTQETALDAFCAGVVDRARLRLPRGDWQLRAEQTGLRVRIDAQQMEQMLENLLNNAYEAAAEAPIELRCGRADDRPFIEVRDRGSGFSADAQGHLFELFYTTKQRGTGIGLANASAIARAHGADLTVRNEGGAVVRIELPASSVVAVSQDGARRADSGVSP